MVVCDARQHIGIELFSRQSRRMAVLRFAVKQGELLRHCGVGVHGRDIIHDFAQAQNARIVLVFFHFCRVKGTAIVLKRQCRHTGRHHHIDIGRYVLRLIQNIINARRAADICRLMRVCDIRRRAALDRPFHQFRRCHHGGFQMQVCINKARAQIFSRQIYFLCANISVTHAHNGAVFDGNRCAQNFSRKHIDDVSAAKYQICLYLSSGCLCQLRKL